MGRTLSNILFSDEYDHLPGVLRELRRRAGLSQRRLAEKMQRSACHVHKIETRQRRIELVEFCRYVTACGGNPGCVFHEVLSLIDQGTG